MPFKQLFSKNFNSVTDRRTDGQTDKQTDRQTNRQTPSVILMTRSTWIKTEFSELDGDWIYDNEELKRIVLEIIKTPYLNRLKQFMLRILHNNLFFVPGTYRKQNTHIFSM